MATITHSRQPTLATGSSTWARKFVWFEESTRVTDRPWAQTWRLSDGANRYYLKELPPQQSSAIEAQPLLHAQFPSVVPEVLGSDSPQGRLLLADHGGQTPRSGMPEALRVRLLETYARLQAEASRNTELLAALPTISPATQLDAFFDYLNPHAGTSVGADFYVGTQTAQSFYQKLAPFRDRLARLLQLSDSLPLTVNHCDLRRSNMALASDGRCLIYDWDEAVAAPAGLSLHNFFSGCSRVARILADAGKSFAADASSRKVQRMNAYVGRLVRHGYSNAAMLRRALPATVCLGVLRYLHSYSAFPRDDEKYRRVVGDIHRDRLDDLVRLCDWLTSQSAVSSTHSGEVASLSSADRRPITAAPTRSEDDEIRELEEFATHPDAVPTVRFTAEEIERQEMPRAKRKLGARLFNCYGTLLIENAFDPELVDRLAEDYFANYRQYSQHTRHADALKVGSRRYMVTIALAGSFHSPAVYAPPLVLPIIRQILGTNMILGSMTAVASLGGSKDMHIHKDHPALFSRREVSHELPSFGVSMILPLLGFSKELGTTRVWKGSHRTSLKTSLKTPCQDPYSSKGSVLLMDYRLTHQGLANRTDRVRPILDLIYQRPWFRDIANYGQQDALIMTDAAWEQIPEQHRSLFEWARKQGNGLTSMASRQNSSV